MLSWFFTHSSYLSALEGHPPLIKRQDYDHDLFDAIDRNSSVTGIDTPSGTPLTGLRAFVDLVTTIGGVLEQLHSGYYGAAGASTSLTIELVFRLEKEMDDLRERLGPETFRETVNVNGLMEGDGNRRTTMAGALIRQIHYNWCVVR